MINFLGRKKIFFSVSIAVIVVGLIAFIAFGGLNLDLDFKGGTALRIDIGTSEFNNDDINTIVESVTGHSAVIQKTGNNNTEAYIKTVEIDTEMRDKVIEEIKEKYSLNQDAVLEATNVTASASTKLIADAFSAIGYSLFFMLIYITFRFDLKSGIAAVIGLLHNVFALIAIYAIFRIPVSSSLVAAILTIVGYSINDTIIVFDRIRENVKFDRKAKTDELFNKSLNQTLTRTINTLLTTLFTITTLYVLGVASIRDFAFPIIIGIIIGTYSSICISTPLWGILKDSNIGKKRKVKRA